MISRRKAAGLAGFLTTAKAVALASVIYLTGNLLPNTNLDETRSIVDNNSTNTVTSTGPIENHSRYWKSGAIADSWVNVFQGTNLVDSVQADSNGDYFFDSYGTNGTEYTITYNSGGTNILDGGNITHNSGGTFEITNNVGESVASTIPLEFLSTRTYNSGGTNYLEYTYPATSGTTVNVYYGGTPGTITQNVVNIPCSRSGIHTNSHPMIDPKGFFRLGASD